MRTICTLLLICLTSGCGGKLEFSNREEYKTLSPYAQDYLDKVLLTYFGEPTEMVAWDKLPLNMHYAQGTVQDGSGRQLSLELSEPHTAIPEGTEVLWMGGNLAGQPSSWIKTWNEEKHLATLEMPLASNPDEGTPVILGPGEILADGRMLYAEHCQHCHGVTGDGMGPTAPYLNPKPRDYRRGIFKFTTTQSSKKASRHDLKNVIENGVPGTYMPSFKLLTEEESTAITEYVMWLAMRGEVEYQLIRLLGDGYSLEAIADRTEDGSETATEIQNEFLESVNDPDSFPAEVDSIVSRLANDWESSQEEASEVRPLTPRVPYSKESIAKGRALYLKDSLKCAQCHGEAGFGDGSQTLAVSKDEAGQDNVGLGLYDTWGNHVKPRNLHTGIYRGGRRPIDLYSRLYAGIKGTPMPAFSTTLLRRSNPEDPNSEMTDEDIWHLVNYIYSVPFEDVQAGSESQAVDPAPASDDPTENEVAAK
ncbi:Cytochrome c [Thalassoglobus polymorphus]|uniref:Cytochrome c n=1 Tax=Thalassoglobus polymorphus TaxID=2527994 RepID=A0A517QRU9_9PLAN|nr:Cytochrome c [Thalassoglobus polymorphus]